MIAGLATVAAGPAGAQDWRSISASRQVRGETLLAVEIDFASGTVSLSPGRRETLYQADVEYDEEFFNARHEYDAERGRLHVGVTPDEIRGGIELDEDAPQFIDLRLTTAVPVDLDLEFGAARAELELGGLHLLRAAIKTGASRSRIAFDTPNPQPCERFEVIVGGAEFLMEGLGNARCERVSLTGGAGEMVADFTGAWPEGTHTYARIRLGVGSLTLRLPENVGVMVDVTRIFASFDDAGFERRGSRYVSPNYDRAAATLEIDIDTALSSIAVEWVRDQ